MVPDCQENMSSEGLKARNLWDMHRKPIICGNYVGKNPS